MSTTNRSQMTHEKEIYQADYWQKKVDALIKEKKNILKVTEENHSEIRKVHKEN